jgi:hypothetical protein
VSGSTADPMRCCALCQGVSACKVRCALSERNLHSRMPLVPTPARLKLLHAHDQ